MWNSGILEYKAILKLYIEAKAKINRQCGCSEEDIQRLKTERDRIDELVKLKTS